MAANFPGGDELIGSFHPPLCYHPSYSWILPTLVVVLCQFPDIACQTQVYYWQDLCGESLSQYMLVQQMIYTWVP